MIKRLFFVLLALVLTCQTPASGTSPWIETSIQKPSALPPIGQYQQAQIVQFSGAVISGLSDNDWPSTSNRPSWNSGTSTLSWVGPSGGGANNGNPVQQSRVLSNSGSITTSSNGQVIQGVNVAAANITVAHDNVTIKQSRIFYEDTFTPAIRLTKASITGLIIEDTLIDGNKNSYGGIVTVSGATFTNTNPSFVRRNTIVGFENNMTLWCSGNYNMTISDNYIGQAGNASSGTYDADMIELYEVNNVTVYHNTFDSTGSQQNTLNSAVNMSNLGAVTNVLLDTNHFVGSLWDAGGTGYVIDSNNSFGGGSLTWSATNNGFINIGSDPFRRSGGPAPTGTNSGNYTSSNINATSGSPTNGTGQI